MKAITLYQPWASLLACSAKKYETRSWATNYRGPIAIHAGLKNPYKVLKGTCSTIVFPMCDALGIEKNKEGLSTLLRGYIIATAELTGCHEMMKSPILGTGFFTQGSFCEITGNELLFGDWTPGRYAWEFANMKMLPEPIPARGYQRLWEWELKIGKNYMNELLVKYSRNKGVNNIGQ